LLRNEEEDDDIVADVDVDYYHIVLQISSMYGHLRVEKDGKNCTWHHTVRYSELVRNVQIAKLIVFLFIGRYQRPHNSINGEDHGQETDEFDLQTQNRILFQVRKFNLVGIWVD
jgi:hypothetical protein